MKAISFIGLGTMGKPMAVNLIKKGFSVTVYNRTAEKTDELVELGADLAATPLEAARIGDVLITMVSNDDALKEVFNGAHGIFEGIRPGMTVIDCSTVSPRTSQKLYQELGKYGVDFLDAPVTGSKPAAEGGTLLFMVGGQKEVLDEHMDIFQAMGSKIRYMGPSGSGSNTKLAHNSMVGIHALALCEGLSIAVKAGLDPEQFLDVVLSGNGSSKQAELKGPKILNRDFSNQFSLKLMLKDLKLASQLTNELEVTSPMLLAAKSVFEMGQSKGWGEQDLCSVMQCYEEWMRQKAKKKTKVEQPKAAPINFNYERRRKARVQMDIKLHLSVHQWENEGSFSGQTIAGTLADLSESGLQIASAFPLARDMFVVIHFPQEANIPPLISRVIRIEKKGDLFYYGCMLSGVPPYVRIRLEEYIDGKMKGG